MASAIQCGAAAACSLHCPGLRDLKVDNCPWSHSMAVVLVRYCTPHSSQGFHKIHICRSEVLPPFLKLLRDSEAEVRVAAASKVASISNLLDIDAVSYWMKLH